MRYAEYRRRGLPITSSYVESCVKQFNARVKGTEKFWTEKGAEALLQLRADYLSDGDELTAFWERRQETATGQREYTARQSGQKKEAGERQFDLAAEVRTVSYTP